MPVLLATLLIARDVSALGVGGATWTPVDAGAVVTLAGYRVSRDSVYVFVRLRWDREGVRALRAYENDGLRYTQEVNDFSGRLSATGFFVTDLPGAAYDRDDDDGDGRWEEVEVTVTDARAIRAGRTYVVGFHFTRWTQRCDDRENPDCWEWNRRGGDLAVLSQLSRFFFGEWQAERWTRPYQMLRYPRMTDPLRDLE
jgi:hypothetical protein